MNRKNKYQLHNTNVSSEASFVDVMTNMKENQFIHV